MGKINSVSMVDVNIPPMTTVAIGFWVSEPISDVSNIGISPKDAAVAVINIGLSLKRVAFSIALSISNPSCKSCLT